MKMNKSGLEFDFGTLVTILIILLAAGAIILAFNNFWGEGISSFKNIQEQTTDKDFLDIDLTEKSQLLEEKEKCDKLTNLNDCLGSRDSKTTCFWGKVENQGGCYSCIVKKNYFGNDFGSCSAYTRSIYDLNDFKTICEFNPCDFTSLNPEKKAVKSCLFSTLENSPDIELKSTFCF